MVLVLLYNGGIKICWLSCHLGALYVLFRRMYLTVLYILQLLYDFR